MCERGRGRELDHKSRERKQRYSKRSQKTEPNSKRKRNLHHPPTVFDETMNSASPISLLFLLPLPLHSLPPHQSPLTLSFSDSDREKEKEKERDIKLVQEVTQKTKPIFNKKIKEK